MKDPLHETPGQVLDKRGHDRASQEQEEKAVLQLRQEDRHRHGACSIDRAERTADESPVYKFVPVHCGHCDLAAPADKRIDKKEPQKLINVISHLIFLFCPSTDFSYRKYTDPRDVL